MGRKAKVLVVKEDADQLKQLKKQSAFHLQLRIQMLLLIKAGKAQSKYELANALGVNHNSAQAWKTAYAKGGLDLLLSDKRGGKKQSIITTKAHQKLKERLNNPKTGFRSFTEIQQWLQAEFDIDAHYQTVNKYVKRKFGARLKVSRKSHVQKDPAAEAVFKKPVRKTRGTSN
jgi:transposase